MKSKLFTLFAAATLMVSQAALAAESQTARSVGAHPVVYDDYPEASLALKAGDDVVLTITGEARTRFEWVENASDFTSDGFSDVDDSDFWDDGYSYAAQRVDLGVRVDLPHDVAAVLELQGAWNWGGDALGLGSQFRALANYHQRPGVVNPIGLPVAISRPGSITGLLGGSGDPAGLASVDSRTSEIGRTLRSASTDDIHVYQGYLEAANVGGSLMSVRIGRQELAYGTEMLLGNQDWYDGMSYDAVKGIFEFNENNRLDVFWAKLAERETTIPGSSFGLPIGTQGGDDADLFGAYFATKSLGGSSVGMDAYLINMKDGLNTEWVVGADNDDGDGYDVFQTLDLQSGRSALDSYWLGVRFFREREHGFHFSAELTYQFGNMDSEYDTDLSDGFGGDGYEDQGNIDLAAWAFEGFAGYTWNTKTNPTIKGGVTWATGTSAGDLDGASSATFFTPGGEIHPRLGLMDLIELSNILAFNLGYTGSVGKHSWGVDFWHFQLDEVSPFVEDYYVTDAALEDGNDLSNTLGWELDLWYNYQYSKNLVMQTAVGWFNPGGYFDDMHNCPSGGCDPGDSTTFDDPNISTADAWRIYTNFLLRF